MLEKQRLKQACKPRKGSEEAETMEKMLKGKTKTITNVHKEVKENTVPVKQNKERKSDK